MDFVDLLEVLDGVLSGQLEVDPADFALHLQSHRDRFVDLLRYKVTLAHNGHTIAVAQQHDGYIIIL